MSTESTTTTMYYSIVAPGTIRSNSDYHVSVSTHDTKEPCVIKMAIVGPTVIEPQEIEIPPNSEKNVVFKLPILKEGDYNFTANGLSGIKFENKTSLNVDTKHRSIFIQTDKATYKPGDLVRFRVLVLDPNTRPVKNDQAVNVIITDAAENRIKQFNNLELIKGVWSGELQLSPFPVLGDWKIEVENGDHKESKNFEIAKYVLPKFETVVEAPKHVLNDGKLRVTVRAKYTYGKPVKGDATVTIKEHFYWSSENEKAVTKTAPLDGKAYVEFDVSELGLKINYYQQEVLISATVEEKLTGNKMNASTTTQVHKDKYRIERVDAPYTYTPNKPFKVTIAVKNYDETPVQDTKNPVKFTMTMNIDRPWPRPVPIPVLDLEKADATTAEPQPEEEPEKQIVEQNLDENGMATVEFTIPEFPNDKDEKNRYKHFSINAKYLDVEQYISSVSKVEKQLDEAIPDLDVKIRNKKPNLKEDVEVEVKTKVPMNNFNYDIVGRGDIIESGRVDIPDDSTTEYLLKIKPRFEMVPRAAIFVYFIKDGNITFKSSSIDFDNQLENSIKIDTPEKAQPGDNIDITVSTDPDSYIGLLGVDQSVLLLKSGNDLSKDSIFGELNRYRTSAPYSYGYYQRPGDSEGLITLTNAHSPVIQFYEYKDETYILRGEDEIADRMLLSESSRNEISTKSFTRISDKKITIRKEFPESWIWQQQQIDTNDDGTIKLQKKVPDTITSWVLTGFSVNPKTGLGLTENPTKLQVFQPFFVSINLPYSVKRGEVINVPVIVFNYLDKDLIAQVTLDNKNGEFEFVEATNDINEALSEDVKRTKEVSVKANSGESVSFLLRSKQVGHVTLKVTAVTPISGDAVEQILLVEPEGVTQFKNKAIFINLKEKTEHKQDIDIEIPENAVPDSVYSEVAVVGDLLGPTIKNLDNLVRMPYGCGEQNMVNFVPNILVLKYLESLKKLNPTISEKAKRFVEAGYQRELTYKHSDGSYSAFGESDKNGSTWLTAYVARSFIQASNYIQIDKKVIDKALQFLSKTQAENGSFPEVGRVIDHHHDEDEKKIFLTSFTLLAFLENKESYPEYNENIKKGINYLIKNIDSENKVYPLTIASYVLQLYGHEQKDPVLEKLRARGISQDDRKYWAEKPKPVEETKKKGWLYWGEPPTNDIESTSYALLSLLESGASGDELVPTLRWLVSKRNSLGGYYSTQATVVGLQALIGFSQKFGGTEKGDIDINFTDDQNTQGKITINDENSLLLQTHILSPETRHVSFTATGKGATLAQVSYRYNIETGPEEPRFNLEANVKETNSAEYLKLDVCASFIPNETEKESNMAVMEVSLPSGYVADQDNLKALEANQDVKKVETKNGDTVVIIYFDSLDSEKVCVPVEGLRTHKIGKQKPAPIKIYDYYDSTRQAGIFYSQTAPSLCDICDGDDCGSGCASAAQA